MVAIAIAIAVAVAVVVANVLVLDARILVVLVTITGIAGAGVVAMTTLLSPMLVPFMTMTFALNRGSGVFNEGTVGMEGIVAIAAVERG